MFRSWSKPTIWLEKNVSSLFLLIVFFFSLPVFILQKYILAKLLLALIFFTIAIFNKKKIHYISILIFIIATVSFNIVVPNGRVMFKIGFFPVTENSLLRGLDKAVTLVGLLFLAKAFVFKSLSIPGKIGKTITKTLYYISRFSQIRKKTPREKSKKLIEYIDHILGRVQKENNQPILRDKQKTSSGGFVFLSVLFMVNVFFLVLSLWL